MGTTTSSLFMTYMTDALMGSTHGLVVKGLRFWQNWPWTIPKAACRVAYIVLAVTSMQRMRWDTEAGCVRIDPPADPDKALDVATKVVQAQIPLTRKWALLKRVGESLLVVHWQMFEQLEAAEGTKVPFLLPSAPEAHEELVSEAARTACEDFLTRCVTGGWVDAMTDPAHEPKTLYERDCYPERALILRQLIPHLHQELMRAGCLRQGRQVANFALALARKRFDAAEERDDPDALKPTLVLKHVQSVQINGSDPSSSSVRVSPEKKRRGVRLPEDAPSASMAIDAMTEMLGEGLEPAYLARDEVYVGGPGAARRLAECIVNAVYDKLRPGEDEKDRLFREQTANEFVALGSVLTGKAIPQSALSALLERAEATADPDEAATDDPLGEDEDAAAERRKKKKQGDAAAGDDDDGLTVTTLIGTMVDILAPLGLDLKGLEHVIPRIMDFLNNMISLASDILDAKDAGKDKKEACVCVWAVIDQAKTISEGNAAVKRWVNDAMECIESLPGVIGYFDLAIDISRTILDVRSDLANLFPNAKHIVDEIKAGKKWADGNYKTTGINMAVSMVGEGGSEALQKFLKQGGEILPHILGLVVEMSDYLKLENIAKLLKWHDIIENSENYKKMIELEPALDFMKNFKDAPAATPAT